MGANDKKTLDTTLIAFLSINFAFSVLFLVYIFIRALYTFPYIVLHGYISQFVCFATREERQKVSMKDLKNAIGSECYFFRNPFARLFFYLQICGCIFMSSEFIPFCYYQYIAVQFFCVANYIWAFIIAVWVFWILIIKHKKSLWLLEVVSHVIVWSLSFCCCIIPALSGSIGYSSNDKVCWIRNDSNHKYMRLTFYIPLWIIMILIVFIYITTILISFYAQYNRFRLIGRLNLSSVRLYTKLLGFPLIFVLLWIIPSIARILQFAKQPVPKSILILKAISQPSSGFWCTLVFVFGEGFGYCIERIYKKYSRNEQFSTELMSRTEDEIKDEAEITTGYYEWNEINE